ncbi:MAG TPA: protein kinase [Phycisphaerales bacterium]|nr:protein kinase [Phycisphaerales bacterium]
MNARGATGMAEARRAREVFHGAAELPRERRAAYLEEQCAGDPALRAEVESLLAFDGGGDGFLEGTPFTASPSLASRMGLRVPDRFGRYRVIRLVGEGGMGAVYEAEQESPRRRVALKVVYPGFASGQLLRRFEHEAHVLGQLRHPGIGQIFEAGWEDTPYGRQPYFAMEFISGPTLTGYAERAGLGARERLELIARVCDAIQHAHMKGVIHRDLKPANILVEGGTERRCDGATKGASRPDVGHPKILDFGIARMTDSDIRYATVQTNAGQLLGTVPYMSPEQVSGDPSNLDARSDVYALGVLMYELLAGRLPYDVTDRPLPEVARVIREQEPRTLAGIDPSLAGDISTIVGKALQKEPDRRYQSAADLAADIRRHLAHEPIAARPPTTFYQLQKFARRNKALVGGVAMAFVTLVVAVVVVASLAVREAQLRRVADESAAAARRLAYRTSIAAAGAALDKHQRRVLRERLDEAPEELRGWEWAYLDGLYDRSLATVRLEPGTLALGFDASGGAALTASPDGWVRALDADTGAELSRIRISESPVTDAALAPDGRTIVATDASGGALTIDVRDWTRRWTIEGVVPGCACVFSADARLVACSLEGATDVGVFDAGTGARLHTVRMGPTPPTPLAFHPREPRLLVLDEPRVVEVDYLTGARRTAPRADRVILAPDGRRAFTMWASYITVYDGADWGETATLRGVTGPVTAWDVSFGLGIAALGEGTGWVSFRGAESGDLANVLCAHAERVQQVAFSSGGDRLATITPGGEMKLWRTPDEPAVRTVPPSNDNINLAVFAPGGRLLATSGWGSVKVWDARTGAERWLRVVAHPGEQGGAVAFSADGTSLAAALRTPGVWLFDAATGSHRAIQQERPGAVDALAWLPEGTALALARGASIEVARASDGAILRNLTAGGSPVTCLAAADAAPLIAAGDAGGAVWLWEGEGGSARPIQAECGSPVTSLAFSPDGATIAAGHADGSARVWPAAGGPGGSAQLSADVRDLAFHPDGSRLLATCADGHMHLLRAADADPLLVLDCATDVLFAGEFAPGGTGIAACGPRVGMALFDSGDDEAAQLERRRVRAARRWVDAAFEANNRVSGPTAASLREDPAVPEDLRGLAVEQALARGDQANWLNSLAWGRVQYPNQPREAYDEGLRMAEGAVGASPDYPSYLNTLGVAQYRVGRHADAAATFERCNRLHEQAGESASAYDVVFLAMAYQGMGRTDEAFATLEAARELIASAPAREQGDLRSMLREAEGVIPER